MRRKPKRTWQLYLRAWYPMMKVSSTISLAAKIYGRRSATCWCKRGSANISVATGRATGFFVIDVDREQGEQSLASLEAASSGKRISRTATIHFSVARSICRNC